MIMLSKEQIIRLHKMQIEATGGSDGIRDEAMLESALSAAFHSFGGVELFPSIEAKISRIAYGLVSNHPFVDGNKRIGTYVMLVLLELNGFNTHMTDDDIVQIGLGMANGSMTNIELFDLILSCSSGGEVTC